MQSNIFGRLATACRALRSVTVVTLVSLAIATSSFAGPGHDHGATAPTTTASATPRVTASSELYQFVGIVEGEVLVIYLDRQADNAPVSAAKLEISIDGTAVTAELQKNGTYEATSSLLRQPGSHEVLITITDGSESDLLVGGVKIPSPAVAGLHFDHSLFEHLRGVASPGVIVWIAAAMVGIAGVILLRSRRALAIVAVALGASTMMPMPASAGPGHDHGPEPGAAVNGNAPQRLPDGTIFLPKPTQRLLEVRTRAVASETTAKTVRFVGRVIANPNRSGVVQSTTAGRFVPLQGGVPVVGAVVKLGDLLGSVSPSFISKDASDMAQALGELDQQISLARSKLARQESLLITNVVSKVAVDETRIQLDGLLKRRADLLASRVQPEELRAPIDGVLIASRVVAGQVIAPTDQLFSIIDPSSLMVEALVFDQASAERIDDAVAVTGDGIESRLKFAGRSRALQQQYAVMKFDLVDPGPALNIGTPVTISARAGTPVTGIILPRAAIAQAPNGQMVVFLHKEPELFEPRAIRFEPFDAQSVLVHSGLAEGDKVVVQGAPLVNQVR